MPTDYVSNIASKLTITDMAKVQIFRVISVKGKGHAKLSLCLSNTS
jgi:predicted RNA-binding protein with RPS1 domain